MATVRLSRDLRAALSAVEKDLEGTIKRGLTNAVLTKRRLSGAGTGVGVAIPTDAHATPFQDVALKMDGNNVTISNLRLLQGTPLRAQALSVSLGGSAMAGNFAWGTVRLQGQYEMTNAKQLQVLPVSHQGNITVVLEGVTATGKIGFSVKDDSFVSTNYLLTYDTQEVRIKVAHQSHRGEIVSEMTRSRMEDTILSAFAPVLWLRLQDDARVTMDAVLSGLYVSEILEDDYDLCREFTMRNASMTILANKVVDKMLLDIRNKINPVVKIDDLNQNFSSKCGLVDIYGDFTASQGLVRNLASLTRNSNITWSNNFDGRTVTLFGELRLKDLRVIFNHYKAKIEDIGPTGLIDLKIRKNTIMVGLKIYNMFTKNMMVKLEDLKITKLDDLDLHVTGLGPLNWLVSLITGWILGCMWESVVSKIEKSLRRVLEEMLKDFKFPTVNQH